MGSDKPIVIDLETAKDPFKKSTPIGPSGDNHYDIASALQKRYAAPILDAAVYWLARMMQAVKICRFIARRFGVCRQKMLGNADPLQRFSGKCFCSIA